MSNSEIKSTIDHMTEEERFVAAAYIQHLARSRDASAQAMLAARMDRMNHGHKLSLEQARRIHASLEGEGL